MSVLLSPVGGVAAQFFTNTGAVLTGGKLYTYASGTTTPATTYTTSSGATAHTNPIVLDAAGRVPSGGEIWLTDGINYKFILKDANDVTIATYDNISGINSNYIAFTNSQEIQTATAGQTVFTLTTMQYQPGTNSLSVFVDGVNQYGPGAQYAYFETDSGTVTFISGLHVGAEVKFTTSQQQGAGAVDASQVTYDPPFTGSVATNVEAKLAQTISVMDFGAVGDGVADDTTAIAAAHATGHPVFYPYGTYKHVGYFPECEGGIIGEGWSTNTGAKKSTIVFYDCTDVGKGAITPKTSAPRSQFFRIENIELVASSWDATTGCLGYGVDIGAPVRMNTVLVQGFKKSNIFVHHVWPVGGSFVSGPYESVFTNVLSTSSGQHGYLVGNGGNVLTFINCEGKYNGAPSFGVNPSVAGNYDGFFADQTADGNDITAYTPENISVIGGDCSYNSRYGWNFGVIANSATVSPGYAEFNLVKEARCGNTIFCLITFNALYDNVLGFLNEQTYTPYFYTNAYFIGGKQVHPANVHSFIENPAARDENGGTIQNAPVRAIYLSRNNAATLLTQIAANTTPDGTAVDLDTETVSTLGGNDTYAVGIGSGARHLKIQDNFIRLPDLWYQAVSTGWNANYIQRSMGSAAPVAGTYKVGDIVYNTAPSAGGYIGWVCVTAGTPGTWKTFGAISA